jgi:hypothetical protein
MPSVYIYRGWKNNGKTTDTVHIPLLIWCCTTFCLQYSHNPSPNELVQVLNSLRFYTILLEEHLQIALEMLEVGICSSL